MSATTTSAWRALSLRASIVTRPSWIARPSQIASVIGAAMAAMMTRRRSRGEMRSQKSRALSVTVDIATSHALRRVDGQLELLHAVVAGLGRTATDFLVEALDLLELAHEQVDL